MGVSSVVASTVDCAVRCSEARRHSDQISSAEKRFLKIVVRLDTGRVVS
jgi:hypothetical protein